jgi:hypothetical protein
LSNKGGTNINNPSDVAFIQYHAHGVTASTYNTTPTEASSGELGRLVIGIGNDSGSGAGEELWLQTPGGNDLKHYVVNTAYTILDTGNVSPALLISGNTIASRVGGVTSSYITVPYATNSNHANDSGFTDFLRTPRTVTARITSLNSLSTDSTPIGSGRTLMRVDLVNSNITDGSAPPATKGNSSGYSLSFSWESNGFASNAASQLYIPNGDHMTATNGEQTIMYRGNDQGIWSSWYKLVSARAGAVGSDTQGIYINANGFATACTKLNADTVDGWHASDFRVYRWASRIQGNTWSRLYVGN